MQSMEDLTSENAMLRNLVRGLHVILVVAALISIVGVALWATGEINRYAGGLVVIMTVAISQWQASKSLRRSVIVIVTGLWAMIAVTSMLLGGVHAVSNLVYPFCIALAGWVLGRRWLLGLLLATVVLLMGMGVAEYRGLMVPAPRPNPLLIATQAWCHLDGRFLYDLGCSTYAR